MSEFGNALKTRLGRLGMTRSLPFTLWWMAVGVALIAVLAAGGYRLGEAFRAPQTRAAVLGRASNQAEEHGAAGTEHPVIWRDRAGNIYRAAVDGGKLDKFLHKQRAKLDAARHASRDHVVRTLAAGIDPTFAALTERVPDYGAWYFSYTTKYMLMAHAVGPTIHYAVHNFGSATASSAGLVAYVKADFVRYMTDQYAARVLHPLSTAERLETAFNNTMAAQQAEWTRLMAEYDAAMAAFLAGEQTHADRIDPAAAASASLDWDGQRTQLSAGHDDAYVLTTLRRGLLTPVVIAPRTNGNETAMLSQNDDSSENAGEVARILVDLFSKMVDPLISETGNMLAGIVAGGVAGGVASGGATGLVAAGAAATVPIGAAIGLAATIGSDLLTNRLEASLTRADFERNLRQALAATRRDVSAKMTEILYQHFEAWHEVILGPLAGRIAP